MEESGLEIVKVQKEINERGLEELQHLNLQPPWNSMKSQDLGILVSHVFAKRGEQ